MKAYTRKCGVFNVHTKEDFICYAWIKYRKAIGYGTAMPCRRCASWGYAFHNFNSPVIVELRSYGMYPPGHTTQQPTVFASMAYIVEKVRKENQLEQREEVVPHE